MPEPSHISAARKTERKGIIFTTIVIIKNPIILPVKEEDHFGDCVSDLSENADDDARPQRRGIHCSAGVAD